MRLYRVHPWIPGVEDTAPYGPLFIPPGQGAGRWDNPDLYELRYYAQTPEGAICETFGNFAQWSTKMFRVPGSADAVRALSTYELPESTNLADLDDPQVLCDLKIPRVTDVIKRNKRRTQRHAARIFDLGGWDGISWRSFYHPDITLAATWNTGQITCIDTEALDVSSDAVQTAAELIVRTVR